MARICITGFYGFSNSGDEGILLAMLDSLGENKYVVCTSLPHMMLSEYQSKFPKDTVEVRQIYDVRSDYDAFILGGGALGWGFGWHQALTAFSSDKPSMYYGVGLNWHERYSPKMNRLYSTFLNHFNAVTIRDKCSLLMANEIGVQNPILTSCPSINLKEEPFNCPKGMIAVCPRYEDWVSNDEQLNWLTNRLKDVEDEVLLIPFAPYNSEGIPIDLGLCIELKKRLPRSQILISKPALAMPPPTSPYSISPFVLDPRKIKYAISKSRLVITGGRYHAVVWASAHNVPFEVCPTSWRYPKVGEFEKMHAEFGGEKLKEMEKKNREIFKEKVLKCREK